MARKAHNRKSAEGFVMLTREICRSDAWRTAAADPHLSLLLLFLINEHLSHGGGENGNLKAPHRQLAAFGIGPQYIFDTIQKAEKLGLVVCHRAGERKASSFTLTFIRTPDGAYTSDLWRSFSNPKLAALSSPKIKNLPNNRKAALPNNRKADGAYLPNNRKADMPENLPNNRKALSRRSIPSSEFSKNLSVAADAVTPEAALGAGSPLLWVDLFARSESACLLSLASGLSRADEAVMPEPMASSDAITF